ncbi:MAG: V-type ATP synthase subunit I, partial [Eubacteriales bacterium]|nr:V-type ATP synthase subunit I [Eubacteriales bacterium]
LPWADMEDPLETVRSTASLKVMTGTVPADGVNALMETGALVQLYGGEKERAALVICRNDEYAGIAPSIRASGFQEKGFGDIRGTASENIQRLRTEIEALEAERARLEARLAAFAPKREEICRALDGAAIDRDREQSKEALAHTNTAFLLTGWVREDMTEKVRREIEKITDVYYLDFEDPSEGDAVPTALKNSRLIAPYEAVTNLYSLPAYGSIDGTPLMAPFYFIFFGMMLSDTVYGAVLALGAWAFLKYVKPRGMMENLAKVLLMGGISTIFMGLLFGTFAGVSWPVILKGTALENTFPLIDSSANPIAMLALCAAMGIIQMFYGVFIAAYSCIKQGDWAGAIVDNLSWVFIITGLLLMAAPSLGLPAALGTAGKWMAIGFAAVVFLFAGRSKKNVAGRLMSGAGKLYDVTSWLGDVLSYARIFALGLSTGVIGLVLNTLCWDMLFASFKGNPVLMVVGFIIVTVLSVALHAFMMAISTLGCFVHSARLQYVEFFGKFYEAGGKAFKPLRYETKYVNVK